MWTPTVKAFSTFGELPSRVLERARAHLKALALPPGYRLEFAGEERELRESRGEMGVVMLVSLSLMALAMVIQFDSVTKSVVVMLTVPLGLIGAFVGVTVMQAPLGFMALLGIVRSRRQRRGLAAATDRQRRTLPRDVLSPLVKAFHSFRVTWITLALAAGVPLELVQRVTGHRTAEVVMKHYFRPGREDFRAAIFEDMPKMLGEGSRKTVKEQMRHIIEHVTPRTWKRDKQQLLELLGGI